MDADAAQDCEEWHCQEHTVIAEVLQATVGTGSATLGPWIGASALSA